MNRLLRIFPALMAVVLITLLTSTAVRSLPAAAPAHSNAPKRTLISDEARSDRALRWADSVMAGMTLRQKVAQLFIPRIDFTSSETGINTGIAAIRRIIGNEEVGGFLLGKGSIEGYARMINAANQAAAIPPMVTLDGEWGLAMRVTDAPRFPYNMGLGAITDPELIELYGAEVARECRELGINVNFAPDVDVNSNPANPVIGYRSFGEDPARVARAGVAYGHGLEGGGVLSVAKHFPGHGDTSTDSHKTLPTVDHTFEQLEEIDLLPFQSYVDAGLGGIMVGHLKVPALDKSGTPASLSHRITTELLAKRMKFDGLIFTDALAMKGAVSPGVNNCVAAFKAGADILLGPGSLTADIRAMVKAVESGEISREAIDRSCRRMLAYKYALGLDRKRHIDLTGLSKRINSDKAAGVAARLADASVTVVHDHSSLLPLRELGSRRIAVVSIGQPARNEFSSMCERYAPVETFTIGQGGPTASQLEKLRSFDVVVAGVFSHAPWAQTAFSKLTSLPSLVGCFFMTPYRMARFTGVLKDIDVLMALYDDTPDLRRAAAKGLFGGIEVDGRFPVNLRGIAKVGDGRTIHKSRLGFTDPAATGFSPALTARLDSVMNAALKAGAFPGAQLVVARRGDVVFDRCYGFTDSQHTTAVTDSTLFDLASVSKATGTLAGLMRAYDEDLFELNDKVSSAIPDLRSTDKKDLTYRQLLFHESGLPAGISPQRLATEPVAGSKKQRAIRPDWISTRPSDDFDREMARGLYVGPATRDSLMHRIYNAKLRPTKAYNYSDLNFCLLMEAEERLTGVDHDQWVATEIFEPLGASTLVYNPLGQFSPKLIAATENDTEFRKQTLRGYVHDETAALQGGVAGNAGLFGSALDVAKLCQMWLNKGSYGGEDLINPLTVELFTRTHNSRGNRALGFDLQPDDSPAPRSTFGHNGFTGTCFWVDPENEIIIVFLSNRVNPSRKNSAFSSLKPRTAVIEQVYRSI